MKPLDISSLSDAELVQTINSCRREIHKREELRKEEAKAEILKIAEYHDIDIRNLNFIPKRRRPRYMNPETHETWAGVGKLPRWLRDELAKGRRREEFEIREEAG